MSELSNNLNPLQASGFQFVTDSRRMANFSFFAQSVSHPGISANAAEVPYSQISSVPQIADKLTYDQLTATILIDEDMETYKEIVDWMKWNVENNDPGVTDEKSHFADLTLNIYDSKNNKVLNIIYRDAHPINVGEITMFSNTDAIVLLNVAVVFRFTSFDIVG